MKDKNNTFPRIALWTALVIFAILNLTGFFYQKATLFNPLTSILFLLGIITILFLLFSKYKKYKPKTTQLIIIITTTITITVVQLFGGINSMAYPLYFILIALISSYYTFTKSIIVTVIICLAETCIFLSHTANDPDLILSLIIKIIFLITLNILVGYLTFTEKKSHKEINDKLASLESGIRTIHETKGLFDQEFLKYSLEKKEMRISRSFMVLDETLQLVADMAMEVPKCHTCAIFLIDRNSNPYPLRLQRIVSKSEYIRRNAAVENNEGIIGLAFKEGKTISISDLSKNSVSNLPYYSDNIEVKSFLATPITGPSGTEGIFSIDSDEQNAFGPDAHKLVSMLTRQISIAIYHAKTQDRTADKTQELLALYEATKALSSPLSVKATLHTILDIAKKISNYDSSYIALLGEEDKKFHIKASIGYIKDFAENSSFDCYSDLFGWILVHKQPVLYTGSIKDTRTLTKYKKEGLVEEVKSFIMIPLMTKEKVLGILKFDSLKQGFFTTYDQEILMIFANQATTAIEHATLYEKNKLMATTDGLTSLYNHRYFQDRLAIEINKSTETKKPLTLILCDIDHFKYFNDHFGHLEGDAILKRIAVSLKDFFTTGIICRYGGEEFAVILPEANQSDASSLAENFRKLVEKELVQKGTYMTMKITISIGTATYPEHATDQRALIHNTDMALYNAKNTGRNKVVNYFIPVKNQAVSS